MAYYKKTKYKHSSSVATTLRRGRRILRAANRAEAQTRRIERKFGLRRGYLG